MSAQSAADRTALKLNKKNGLTARFFVDFLGFLSLAHT